MRSASKSEIMRHMLYRTELVQHRLRQLTAQTGQQVNQCVQIIDLEGFGTKQLWVPGMLCQYFIYKKRINWIKLKGVLNLRCHPLPLCTPRICQFNLQLLNHYWPHVSICLVFQTPAVRFHLISVDNCTLARFNIQKSFIYIYHFLFLGMYLYIDIINWLQSNYPETLGQTYIIHGKEGIVIISS